MLLLIFLLPLFLGVQWLFAVTGTNDGRKVYSKQAIAEFRDGRYNPDTSELKPCSQPVVTITFDDGWESSYTEALPVLEKYGIKSTQYLLAKNFEDPQYLSEAQVKSMQAAGHEVGAHTVTHSDLTILPEENIEWELGESDKLLTQKFGTTNNFATPLGASNEVVISHAKPYFRSIRNTAGDPAVMTDVDINLCESLDPYNINAYTVRDTTTEADIRNMIDYTVKRKGWLVLTYHQVGDVESHWAVSRDKLDQQMKMIRDSGVRTATMNEVLDAVAKEKGGM